MSAPVSDIIDGGAKMLAAIGVLLGVFNYRRQVNIKRAEWSKSLFEKFYENKLYKEARAWLDYDELEKRLHAGDPEMKRENEEKFTDFLNFFEFIGVLHFRKELSIKQVKEMFDYYLVKMKQSNICNQWIRNYGFEKLGLLLNKIDASGR